MIELTEEQKQIALDCDLLELPHEKTINYLLENLTLSQIKQLSQEHNASVVQWVEFNENDKSTWPDETSDILGLDINKDISIYEHYGLHGIGFFHKYELTHWAYIPEPKDK